MANGMHTDSFFFLSVTCAFSSFSLDFLWFLSRSQYVSTCTVLCCAWFGGIELNFKLVGKPLFGMNEALEWLIAGIFRPILSEWVIKIHSFRFNSNLFALAILDSWLFGISSSELISCKKRKFGRQTDSKYWSKCQNKIKQRPKIPHLNNNLLFCKHGKCFAFLFNSNTVP